YCDLPRPPRSTLLPYTTLFRSGALAAGDGDGADLAGLDMRRGRRHRVDAQVDFAADQRRDQLRAALIGHRRQRGPGGEIDLGVEDRKSTRLNSSHVKISYAVFC